MLIRTLWVTLMMLTATHAEADYMVDLLRISCVPEARFFTVEYRPIHSDAVEHLRELFDANGKRRTDIWASQGLYFPGSLDQSCELPGVRFRVVTKQEPWQLGYCGAGPTIELTLYRDGKVMIDRILFGRRCPAGPAATRIDIFDGEGPQRFNRSALIHFSESGDIVLDNAEFLMGEFDAENEDIPIKQSHIERYVARRRQ
jgi:hypothetical protein